MKDMRYARIKKTGKLIPLKLEGSRKPYKELFEQTNTSGHEVWQLYSHNNFDNPLQQADEELYDKMGWWAEIFRDIVRDGGKGTDEKARLHIKYISNADTEQEKEHIVWAPKNGFWVSTSDGIFHENTLIPFETVSDRKEAIKRLGAKGIPADQVSYFWRLNSYKNDERFVGRFDPGLGDCGRFRVDANRLPSNSGLGRVASRPAIEKQEIVMEI